MNAGSEGEHRERWRNAGSEGGAGCERKKDALGEEGAHSAKPDLEARMCTVCVCP